ncbi:MAG: hypothetical protein AAFV07_09035, partial [Bacteroidota bacterium]
MIELLKANPLLLLFVVAALGYGIGSIRIGKTSLGVAAVLFVGLAVGALDPGLQIPNLIFFLGLSMFVYSIGLSSGRAFFAAFQRDGAHQVAYVVLMLGFSALLAVGLHFLFHFDAATTAGLFAGSSTNTPALAGLLDTFQKSLPEADQVATVEAAVVGYSITYPMGVVGVMLAISLMRRLLKIDYAAEAEKLRHQYPIDSNVHSITLRITQEKAAGVSLRDLSLQHGWTAVFGRMKRQGEFSLTNWD